MSLTSSSVDVAVRVVVAAEVGAAEVQRRLPPVEVVPALLVVPASRFPSGSPSFPERPIRSRSVQAAPEVPVEPGPLRQRLARLELLGRPELPVFLRRSERWLASKAVVLMQPVAAPGL